MHRTIKPLNRKLRQRYSQATVLGTSHSPTWPVLIHLFPSGRTYRNGAKSSATKQTTPRPRAAIASLSTGLSEFAVFPIFRIRNFLERDARTTKIPIETTTNPRLPYLATSDTRCNHRISTHGFTNEPHTATSATQPTARQIPSATTETRRVSRIRKPASARTSTTMQLSCRGGTGLSMEECWGSHRARHSAIEPGKCAFRFRFSRRLPYLPQLDIRAATLALHRVGKQQAALPARWLGPAVSPGLEVGSDQKLATQAPMTALAVA